MFSSISWKIFFTFFATAVAGYYFITTILLFRKEIFQLIRSRSGNASPSQPGHGNLTRNPIMGLANVSDQKEERSSLIDAEQLHAHSVDEIPQSIDLRSEQHPDTILIGSVSDLVNELKTLIQISAEYKSGKDECESLFKASLLKYPHLKGTSYQHAINGYICEEGKNSNLAFDLSLHDVQQWWS